MNPILQALKRLSSAEEMLDFLAVDYDPAVVNVSRLHILKRFSAYLADRPEVEEMGVEEARATCHCLLARAYADLAGSSGVQQKLFRVFQGTTQRIPMERLVSAKGGLRHA